MTVIELSCGCKVNIDRDNITVDNCLEHKLSDEDIRFIESAAEGYLNMISNNHIKLDFDIIQFKEMGRQRMFLKEIFARK